MGRSIWWMVEGGEAPNSKWINTSGEIDDSKSEGFADIVFKTREEAVKAAEKYLLSMLSSSQGKTKIGVTITDAMFCGADEQWVLDRWATQGEMGGRFRA